MTLRLPSRLGRLRRNNGQADNLRSCLDATRDEHARLSKQVASFSKACKKELSKPPRRRHVPSLVFYSGAIIKSRQRLLQLQSEMAVLDQQLGATGVPVQGGLQRARS